MIHVHDLTVPGATGEPAALAGHLLCFVEHAFTPDAERVARLAARAHRQGTPCCLVSADSGAALGAFVAGLGLDLPVAGDADGALARRVERWNEAAFAPRPGWVKVGRDGLVITAGDGDLPRAVLVFLGTAESHAATGTPVAAAPPAEPARMPPSGWMYLGLSAALVVVAVAVFFAAGGRDGRSAAPAAAPPAAAPAAEAPAAGSPDAPETPAAASTALLGGKGSGNPKGTVGGGWFAVPPALAGIFVRYADGVVEVEGSPNLVKAPMACQEATTPMTGPLRVTGQWQIDHVGTRDSKGARVAARLLDARGTILPAGTIPGGSQVLVANGRLKQDWAPFDKTVPADPQVAQVRICVDNQGGSGVVRVRDVKVGAP